MQKIQLLVVDLSQQDASAKFLANLPEGQWAINRVETLEAAKRHLSNDTKLSRVVLVLITSANSDSLIAIDQLMQLNKHQTHEEWVLLHSPFSTSGLEGGNAELLERLEDQAYISLEMPISPRRLTRIVTQAARAALISARVQNTNVQQLKKYRLDAFYGASAEAKKVREFISRLATVPLSTLFIFGETGTGKGLVARLVHHMGKRHDAPLVELNCAALPHDLLESELFGHEAGAFTGAKTRHRGLMEQADGGTLFLDEIGDMDISLQAKLLKAIEDKSVRRLGSEQTIDIDVQIIAATSADIRATISAGDFREDLYHRLSVFSLSLPPLRERINDLTDLVPPLIAEFNHKAKKNVTQVPEDAWVALMQHRWPGNVRELRNVIERCVLFAQDEILPSRWLQLPTSSAPGSERVVVDQREEALGGNSPISTIDGQAKEISSASPNASSEALPDGATPKMTISLDGSQTLDNINKEIIQHALTLENNNISQAAKRLGITRQTLRYRIKKHDIKT